MKIRWKFLTFLAVFLTGSFLIVTWKAYDIFAQKHLQTVQGSEIRDLEKQATAVEARFAALQNILRHQKDIEAQLQAQGISLFAHVVNDEGKWKAQWFEGEPGLRSSAKDLARQIPFESLSSTKRSWHMVTTKEKGSLYGYVIPAGDKNKMGYFAFFLSPKYIANLFKGASLFENLSVYSPQIGEIHSVGESRQALIEKNKKSFSSQQNGFIALDRQTALVYYFHPGLQLYLVKNFSIQPLVVENSVYLISLFVIMAFLIGLSVVALDLLFRNLFARIQSLTVDLRIRYPSESTFSGADELSELEYLVARVVSDQRTEAPSVADVKVAPPASVAAAAVPKEDSLSSLRPKVINCLGYLHRLKGQLPADSAHLTLLEKELRELRAAIDPVTVTTPAATPVATASEAPAAPQPYFNPILESFKKGKEKTPFVESTERSSEGVSSSTPSTSAPGLTIRKPKREGHESNNI